MADSATTKSTARPKPNGGRKKRREGKTPKKDKSQQEPTSPARKRSADKPSHESDVQSHQGNHSGQTPRSVSTRSPPITTEVHDIIPATHQPATPQALRKGRERPTAEPSVPFGGPTQTSAVANPTPAAEDLINAESDDRRLKNMRIIQRGLEREVLALKDAIHGNENLTGLRARLVTVENGAAELANYTEEQVLHISKRFSVIETELQEMKAWRRQCEAQARMVATTAMPSTPKFEPQRPLQAGHTEQSKPRSKKSKGKKDKRQEPSYSTSSSSSSTSETSSSTTSQDSDRSKVGQPT